MPRRCGAPSALDIKGIHPDNQTAVITAASAGAPRRRNSSALDAARTRYTLQCRKQQFLRIIVSGRQ